MQYIMLCAILYSFKIVGSTPSVCVCYVGIDAVPVSHGPVPPAQTAACLGCRHLFANWNVLLAASQPQGHESTCLQAYAGCWQCFNSQTRSPHNSCHL
jgi:hypothetical protein